MSASRFPLSPLHLVDGERWRGRVRRGGSKWKKGEPRVRSEELERERERERSKVSMRDPVSLYFM